MLYNNGNANGAQFPLFRIPGGPSCYLDLFPLETQRATLNS